MHRPTWLLSGLLALCSPTATASDLSSPSVGVDALGRVRGEMLLSVRAPVVLATLRDGAKMARFGREVKLARAMPAPDPASGCQLIHMEVTGLAKPFQVRTERCPTAQGWVERLVESKVFTRWDAQWTVVRLADDLTRVEYVIHTDLKLPVPRRTLLKRSQASVHGSLQQLAAEVGSAE